jgi:hypothetical protein
MKKNKNNKNKKQAVVLSTMADDTVCDNGQTLSHVGVCAKIEKR